MTNSPLLGTNLRQHNHRQQQSIPPNNHYQQQSIPPNNDGELSGWPRIAKLMVDKPGWESYSRFRELNVKNLLYYQVELSVLSAELTKIENEDRNKKGDVAEMFARNAELLIEADQEQWKIVLKIRRLLKQYSKLYRCD